MVVQSLSYAQLVKSCRDPGCGRAIHCELQALGLDQDIYLANLLVQMYGKLGCMTQATDVFQKVRNKNIFSWTILMTGYAENGLDERVLELFRIMLHQGVKPDRVTFITLLKAVSRLEGAVHLARELEDMVRGLFHLDKTVVTALLNLYGSCGSLEDVNRLFFDVLNDGDRDLVSWNSLLAAHARHGEGTGAVNLFHRLLLEGVKPDAVTLASITGVCSRHRLLSFGRKLHELVILSSEVFTRDGFLAAALVNMYSKCSCLDGAEKVFERTDVKKSLVSWNAMLAAYAQLGQREKTLKLFAEMELEGVKPSPVTYINVLGACCTEHELVHVKHIRLRVLDDEQSADDVVVATSLVNSFCLCGSLADGEAVFHRMVNRTAASWNALISGYVQHEAGEGALILLRKMENEGVRPNDVTFLTIVEACTGLGVCHLAKSVHERLSSSRMSTELGTAVVNMYAGCESPEDAEEVFLSLEHKDTVSWNAIISCASVNGCCSAESHGWYRRMELEGVKPDRTSFTFMLASSASLSQLEELRDRVFHSGYALDEVMVVALIEKYTSYGHLERAMESFDELHGVKSVTVWTAMVSACLEHEHAAQEAWCLFGRMNLEGVKANSVTVISLLSAPCCSLAPGRKLHELVVSGEVHMDQRVGTALVNLYGKYGELQRARDVFDDVPERNNVCYNSLLKAYAQHGHTYEVLETFREMNLQGVEPNTATFIFVLHACSHAGKVKEACEHLNSVRSDFHLSVTIQHYVCIIDALSRGGWVENARELIDRMPFEPNSLAWNTLLAACAQYGKVRQGVVAADQVGQLEKDEHGAAYVLFSNMHLLQVI